MAQCPGQDKRFWKPEDIFDIDCPKCGAKVEFWKDDIDRRCGKCGHRFRNPRLDLGCAEWCSSAKYCIGREINNENPESKSVQGEKEENMKTVMKRQIIHINEDKCTGCGECIPNCTEGALQIIDGKARLMSDLFCDGLGACIGHCPEGAISTEEREAEPYDERKVMANIVKAGENTIKAHLKHLKEHNQDELLKQALGYLKENKISVPVWEEHKEERLPCVPMYRLGGNAGRSASEHRSGYPGTAMRSFSAKLKAGKEAKSAKVESQLTQWPVQLHLVPPNAPFLKGRDLVIAADCTAYAYGPAPLHFGGSRLNGSPLPKVGGNFHAHFLRDKALVIACPKLDNTEPYLEKLTEMFKVSGVKSITVLHMEVPCCSGLVYLAQKALEASGRKIPAKEITIGIQGDILGESKTN